MITSLFRCPLPSGSRNRILAFLCLSLLVVVVYAPSFYHVPRGDQINYFAEMASRHGFVETVFGTFDLNRTRDFAPGDELAFRPLLYVILGLQKYFFGYAIVWWQVFSVAAHLFALGALYALVCRIQGGAFALAVTAFFAFLPVNIEAVVWSHISAYVIFAGCVLMALRDLYASGEEDACATRHAMTALGWMVPMVLLYEAGVWYAILMGVWLWSQRRLHMAWGAWGIAGIALVANALDLAWRGVGANVAAGFGSFDPGKVVLLTLAKTALLAKWFISSALFLGRTDLIPLSRMMVREDVVSWVWPWGATFTWSVVVGLFLIVAGITGIIFFGLFRGGARRNVPLFWTCVTMLTGYLVIIALGRINWLGTHGMQSGLYYPYNFLVLAGVVAALVSRRDAGLYGRWVRVLRLVLGTVLGAVIIFNAWHVRRTVEDVARDHAASRGFIVALDRFVRQHEGEPGFSFYAGPEHRGNYTAGWLTRRDGAPGHVYVLGEALYPQYFSTEHPRYILKSGF